jgi:hypothetical protein
MIVFVACHVDKPITFAGENTLKKEVQKLPKLAYIHEMAKPFTVFYYACLITGITLTLLAIIITVYGVLNEGDLGIFANL